MMSIAERMAVVAIIALLFTAVALSADWALHLPVIQVTPDGQCVRVLVDGHEEHEYSCASLPRKHVRSFVQEVDDGI